MNITIIMPVYNDPMCDQAIKSVIDQKYNGWQLEILDNGSTDEKTLQVLKKYEGRKGITVTHYPFNRQSECGALFSQDVTTPLLAHLFSDDQWHPEYLKTMIGSMGDADAVFCNTAQVDEDGALWKKPPATQFSGDITEMTSAQHLYTMFMDRNTLHPCAMVIRTETYKRLGGFNPCLHRVGDMILFARLLAEANVLCVKDKLAYITTNSVCSGKKNLSFGNDRISLELMVERQQFLQLFATDIFLDMAPEIFDFKPGCVQSNLFNVGLEAIKNTAADYTLFGYGCMYWALDQYYDAINDWCMKTHHTSAGEYIKTLQQRRVA